MIRFTRSVFLATFCVFIALFSIAQSKPPKDWFLLDPATDGLYGTSIERAYAELLKGKTSQTVIVAVVDGGVDPNHEDLKSKMWVNPKETAANQIDDDGNGYVDDIYGWNFIGGKSGNVQYDQLEITRLYRQLHDQFGNSPSVGVSTPGYERYLEIKKQYEERSFDSRINYKFYKGLLNDMETIFSMTGSQNPSADQLENLNVPDSLLKAKILMTEYIKEGTTAQDLHENLKDGVEMFAASAEYHYNPDYNSRYIVGDNYEDVNDRYYGNNDVEGPEASHGTHVAGIIGADRSNSTGIKGIADNVKIMALRTVPDGDERDKDVANSIRYAVDNGAKVINMSFGKAFSYNKKAVDDAMKYASERDVLLVHGAGNDAIDVDIEKVFPNKHFENGGMADNFINVGASRWDNAVALFSDYGKKNVDLFAPGVAIYSTVPGDRYKNMQGTSMAAPMVSGAAALLRSYYPSLTAPQIREILIKSCTKMPGKVKRPGDEEKLVKWKELAVSGGILNCYKAVQLAEKKSK
jgi:subtilisin family serine protease